MFKQTLIIGTTNTFRYNKIKGMIVDAFPELEVRRKSLNINESGRSTEENASIKSREYYAAFKLPTLCFDDGIYLNNRGVSPGEKIKRTTTKEFNNIELIQYWQRKLRNRSYAGKLIKSFALTKNPQETFTKTLEYDIELRGNPVTKKLSNPLNNFIFLINTNKSLSNFTSKEVKLFREKEFETISGLLHKLNR